MQRPNIREAKHRTKRRKKKLSRVLIKSLLKGPFDRKAKENG